MFTGEENHFIVLLSLILPKKNYNCYQTLVGRRLPGSIADVKMTATSSMLNPYMTDKAVLAFLYDFVDL